MKFRLLATLIVVLAGVGAARAQATFPHETDNAALRYWFALAEVREPTMRPAICSERPSLAGLRGTKPNLGQFWIPTSTRFEPCSGPRSFLYAIGDSTTATGRPCPRGSLSEGGCCPI